MKFRVRIGKEVIESNGGLALERYESMNRYWREQREY
jgi:hypothetical protein